MSATLFEVIWQAATPQAQLQGQAVPWWVWIFAVVILVFMLAGVWIRSQGKGTVKPEKDLVGAAYEPKSQPRLRTTPAAAPPAPPAEALPLANDNLEAIEGIGPHIAGVLQRAGITRFSQLASTSSQQIRELLVQDGLRSPADPTTWPEQARLASLGKWQDLKSLQDSLKAGRKVN